MTQMHRAVHGYVLFYFIGSRAPYGVYSPMWRIKHEWTERPGAWCKWNGFSLSLTRGGTGETGREESATKTSRTLLQRWWGKTTSRDAAHVRVYTDAHTGAQRAMWTQSRSSDRLIDCLYGGRYLGVSSWTGWQRLSRIPPWEANQTLLEESLNKHRGQRFSSDLMKKIRR